MARREITAIGAAVHDDGALTGRNRLDDNLPLIPNGAGCAEKNRVTIRQ